MFDVNEISAKAKGGTELMREGLQKRLPQALHEPFQIISSRVREIDSTKKAIYWIHDLPQDPELKHLGSEESRKRFTQIVFCGNWQAQQFRDYLKVPYHGSAVIDNAVEPIDLDANMGGRYYQSQLLTHPPRPQVSIKKPIRLIYTSTPQRGLELLVPVVAELAKHFDIHLDVYSSFKIYGWDSADEQYEPLYAKIREHPNMTYHGFASNEVVRNALKQAHIFAYPSIWPECNSCALIEAMSAGLVCIHPNYAGLADTSGGLTQMYGWEEDPQRHAQKFMNVLGMVLQQMSNAPAEGMMQYTGFVKSYADSRFNWDRISGAWTQLLTQLSEQNAR